MGSHTQEAFFQPYLPLQQIDLCTTQSWLIGTTNQIMLQQRDAAHDCLVNVRVAGPLSYLSEPDLTLGNRQIEHTTLEFSDPKLERLVALTPADRRWMDEIVRTVEETWNPEGTSSPYYISVVCADLSCNQTPHGPRGWYSQAQTISCAPR